MGVGMGGNNMAFIELVCALLSLDIFIIVIIGDFGKWFCIETEEFRFSFF